MEGVVGRRCVKTSGSWDLEGHRYPLELEVLGHILREEQAHDQGSSLG